MSGLSEKDNAEIDAAIVAEFAPQLRAIRERAAARRAAAAKAEPKPAVVAVVSEKFAEAAKANPESVRLSAKAADDTYGAAPTHRGHSSVRGRRGGPSSAGATPRLRNEPTTFGPVRPGLSP